MKTKENKKPNLYKRINRKFDNFYRKNLQKFFRVRPDIFKHILVCLIAFPIALWFETTNEWLINWKEAEDAVKGAFALAVVVFISVAKEAWDYFSGTGEAQWSDFSAGLLTGIVSLIITYSINNWSLQLGIVYGFVLFMVVMKFVVWGKDSNL